MTTAVSGRGGRGESGELAPELSCWLALYLVPTLAFKYFYLTELYGNAGGTLRLGLFTILDSPGGGSGWFSPALRLAQLLCIDVLEVTAACAALFLAARLALPRIRAYVMAAILLVALLVTAANAISVRQLGSLLTAETLAIAYDWTKGHPSILGQFVSVPKVVALLGALAWASVPLAWNRMPLAGPWRSFLHRRVAPALLLLAVAGSILGLVARGGMTESAPRSFRGYWSSTVASLRGAQDPGPCVAPPAGPEEAVARYRRLVFPEAPDRAPGVVAVPAQAPAPRHVIVVVLETAPRKYYPLTGDPALPTFHRMARSALVSDRHYTTVPFTKTALFSIVSGTYPRAGKGLQGFGDFESDSLATVLGKHGFETSFINSYKIDWMPGLDDRRMWRDLGFSTLLDETSDTPMHEDASFELLAGNERRAFGKIFEAVRGARDRGRHAFVLAATAMGHFDWKAPAGKGHRPAAERVHGLAAFFDGLFADLLAQLAAEGLGEEVLIVVTGDHGLRYGAEFASLGEIPGHGDAEFNVPFLLYAPGLSERTVRLPHLTSHVNIAPTLLALLGMEDQALVFHGSSMLDGRLSDRTTFMLNANLAPVGGMYRKGLHYTVNHLTGAVTIRPDAHDAGRAADVLPDDAVKSTLAEADRVFDATACVFLQRVAPGN